MICTNSLMRRYIGNRRAQGIVFTVLETTTYCGGWGFVEKDSTMPVLHRLLMVPNRKLKGRGKWEGNVSLALGAMLGRRRVRLGPLRAVSSQGHALAPPITPINSVCRHFRDPAQYYSTAVPWCWSAGDSHSMQKWNDRFFEEASGADCLTLWFNLTQIPSSISALFTV